MIEEAALKLCYGIESCMLAENAHLSGIYTVAFSQCCSLRSFYIPLSVEVVDENCFQQCRSLRRLRFVSGELLKRFVSDSTLDEALESLGFDQISRLFRVEIDDGVLSVDFPG
jgi:hypothetical protein